MNPKVKFTLHIPDQINGDISKIDGKSLDSSELYIVLIFILYLIGVLFKKVFLPKIKGVIGEYSVARKLRRLNKNDYIVYNDIYLKNKGRSKQIDHLILSVYGIFVIETKNYKGWIFGNESSKYWTQTLYKNKYKIFNPVIQSWSHINFLKQISSEFTDLRYFPIVVFAGAGKLKKIKSSVPVIYKRKLLRTIRRNKEIHITHSQLKKIDHLIEQVIVEKKDFKKKHRKFVKRISKRDKKRSVPRYCPKCGGKLTLKSGKYGEFYGCSNFPECSYTKNK